MADLSQDMEMLREGAKTYWRAPRVSGGRSKRSASVWGMRGLPTGKKPFVAMASPWEKGYVESFKGRFRQQLLERALEGAHCCVTVGGRTTPPSPPQVGGVHPLGGFRGPLPHLRYEGCFGDSSTAFSALAGLAEVPRAHPVLSSSWYMI